MGLVWCGAAACGQELVVPDKPTSKLTDAPNEGFTGAGGVADETAPSARLPVSKEPIFTTFGGAGGAAGEEADGDAPNRGGAGGLATGGLATGGTPAAGGQGMAALENAGGDANAGAGGRPSLLFSEYVEGSGSLKALEIYALEASSLEGCELETYSNGKLEPSRLALHGQLERGAVQVLCSATLATAQPSACSRSTNLTFNGDDALALSCGRQILDVIGQIGVDPGDAWGMGATLDHTLRRRCEVSIGRSDGTVPFDIDPEWLTLGRDTVSDLGVRNCAP